MITCNKKKWHQSVTVMRQNQGVAKKDTSPSHFFYFTCPYSLFPRKAEKCGVNHQSGRLSCCSVVRGFGLFCFSSCSSFRQIHWICVKLGFPKPDGVFFSQLQRVSQHSQGDKLSPLIYFFPHGQMLLFRTSLRSNCWLVPGLLSQL